MKQYQIYLTTNLINNKKYIGQHYGYLNDNYIGSGNTLKKAIEKYGKENFKKEILEICDSYEEMNEAEKKWIKEYNAVQSEEFYNIATGGFNSNPCAGLSVKAEQERRRKLSNAVKGEKNYFYGKHYCGKDHPMYGKHHTEEAKQKMHNAKANGKSPTARGVLIYDENGNFICKFDTQTQFKEFLGLSRNGSTDTLHKYIRSGKLYHGYIVKWEKEN